MIQIYWMVQQRAWHLKDGWRFHQNTVLGSTKYHSLEKAVAFAASQARKIEGEYLVYWYRSETRMQLKSYPAAIVYSYYWPGYEGLVVRVFNPDVDGDFANIESQWRNHWT